MFAETVGVRGSKFFWCPCFYLLVVFGFPPYSLMHLRAFNCHPLFLYRSLVAVLVNGRGGKVFYNLIITSWTLSSLGPRVVTFLSVS